MSIWPNMKAAIISPSAPSTHTPERKAQFEAGLKNLEMLGFDCAVGMHAKNALSFVSDTAENRLADLVAAYGDKSVEIIVAANGGWNGSDLLSEIDWELIRNNSKPLVGFSDTTVLLNATFAATHSIQIHGPMVTWGFSENDEMTNKYFKQAIDSRKSELPTDEFGKFLRGGSLEGIGVGGNLISLETLLGTPYEPDWRGKILFWEETEETLYRVLRSLSHFKNAGVWDKISGMIIGHLDRIDGKFADTETDPLQATLDHLKPYGFPIIKTELFGHGTKTQLCLPVGGKIKADDESITFGF